MPVVSPFPYGSLPSVPRQDQDLGGRMKRLWQGAHGAAAQIVIQRLLGCEAMAEWGVPARSQARPDAQVAVMLTNGRYDVGATLLTCERGLAQALADAALGADFPQAVLVAGPDIDALSRGALVYLSARCLAALGGDYHVLDCVTDQAAIEAALTRTHHIRWPMRLTLGKLASHVALWMPVDDVAKLPAGHPAMTPQLPPELPLRVSAHGGSTTITVRELTELQVGDVVLLEHCSLELAIQGARGRCTLHVNHAFEASLEGMCDGLRFTVGHPVSETRTMTEGSTQSKSLAARALAIAGDAPVPLSLELARFTVSLETLAGLSPGDVLSARAPIGQQISLRAGDVEVATGELVEVDGEIGVRIAHVAGDKTTLADGQKR